MQKYLSRILSTLTVVCLSSTSVKGEVNRGKKEENTNKVIFPKSKETKANKIIKDIGWAYTGPIGEGIHLALDKKEKKKEKKEKKEKNTLNGIYVEKDQEKIDKITQDVDPMEGPSKKEKNKLKKDVKDLEEEDQNRIYDDKEVINNIKRIDRQTGGLTAEERQDFDAAKQDKKQAKQTFNRDELYANRASQLEQ